MIERVYLKNHLSFDEVELNFYEVDLQLSKGLMIFTGPSGAGKSVLLQGILAIFAYFEASANISEALIDDDLDLTQFGIQAEGEIVFRQIKKEKVRYFINAQAVSKKTAKKIANNFIDYLSLRNADEFKNENLLLALDKFSDNNLDSYNVIFNQYKTLQKKLIQIKEKEKQAIELKEFLEYEITKIENISPKEGEFEELMEVKKSLSKIEKLKELSLNVNKIFEYENSVTELLNLLEIDESFFNESMNELRNYIDLAQEKANYLENINIEEVLTRLEELQGLIKRFGGISESLLYLKEKKIELQNLQNLSFEKETIQKEITELYNELLQKAKKISKNRQIGVKIFESKLNYFLDKLYMPNAEFILKETELNSYGIDKIEIIINQTQINSLSTGEFNRLRLAMLGSKIEFENKPKSLFLDEIDANLSGQESMSVAEVLKFLSKKYQIFAISHQPQLTSFADKHFFVGKEKNKSFVKELNDDERVDEIARIISGKELNKEAILYAKQLLKENNG